MNREPPGAEQSSLEKLSFSSLSSLKNPCKHWVFRIFLCTLRDVHLAVFSQFYTWRVIEVVITRRSWKQFGCESPRGFESLYLHQSKKHTCRSPFCFGEYNKRDSNAVNKTTRWVVLWTVTEGFCGAQPQIKIRRAPQKARTNPSASARKTPTCLQVGVFQLYSPAASSIASQWYSVYDEWYSLREFRRRI